MVNSFGLQETFEPKHKQKKIQKFSNKIHGTKFVELFNLYPFPLLATVLKADKSSPFHQKHSKKIHSNYGSIFCLSKPK